MLPLALVLSAEQSRRRLRQRKLENPGFLFSVSTPAERKEMRGIRGRFCPSALHFDKWWGTDEAKMPVSLTLTLTLHFPLYNPTASFFKLSCPLPQSVKKNLSSQAQSFFCVVSSTSKTVKPRWIISYISSVLCMITRAIKSQALVNTPEMSHRLQEGGCRGQIAVVIAPTASPGKTDRKQARRWTASYLISIFNTI